MLIKNGIIIDGHGRKKKDIRLEDGRIAQIAGNIEAEAGEMIICQGRRPLSWAVQLPLWISQNMMRACGSRWNTSRSRGSHLSRRIQLIRMVTV